MKNRIPLLVIIAIAFLPIGCLKNSCTETVQLTIAEPILIEEINFRVNPEWLPPRPINRSGKIYIRDSYLLINEFLEGIHVYDNSTPTNPIALGFISIPGNVDMTFDGNYLYADSYTDLLSINWLSPGNITLVDRYKDVFEESFSKWDNKLVAYYETRDTIVDFDCHKRRKDWFLISDSSIAFDRIGINGRLESSTDFNNISAKSEGKAGSLARFSKVGPYLYTVSDQSLSTFKIQNNGSMHLTANQKLGFGIETIFPFKNYLFVGAVDGLHILNIAQPDNPVLTSRFDHARACDPVVVDRDLAYVTLRSGITCPGGNNRLEVINVADVYNPFLISSHEMENPYGLGKWNDYLFICEGLYGFSVFNAQDPDLIKSRKINEFKGIIAYDVIPVSLSQIIVTGPEGVYQFDFSDEKNIVLLSKINRN